MRKIKGAALIILGIVVYYGVGRIMLALNEAGIINGGGILPGKDFLLMIFVSAVSIIVSLLLIAWGLSILVKSNTKSKKVIPQNP